MNRGEIAFLSSNSYEIEAGEESELRASFDSYDTWTEDAFTFTSSNESVVSIVPGSVKMSVKLTGSSYNEVSVGIKGVSVGTATITVTTADGRSAACNVTVSGETEPDEPTEMFDYWSFSNSIHGWPSADGYYLSDRDRERLSDGLGDTSNTDMKKIDQDFGGDWNGSCFGMSAWVALVYNGELSPRDIPNVSKGTNLLSLSTTSRDVQSAINFYTVQQSTSNYLSAMKEFTSLSAQEQLNYAKEANLDQNLLFIDFEYYKTGEDVSFWDYLTAIPEAHAIIGYALEEGSWQSGTGDDALTYTYRLLTYDPSYPDATSRTEVDAYY